MTNARKGFDLDLRDGVEFENKVLELLVGGKTVEVKYQPDAMIFLFIETSYRGRPSGLTTTEAEWWAIAYAQGRQIIFVRTDVLKAIIEAGTDRGVRKAQGGDDQASHGFVVPIVELARRFPG